MQARQKSKLLSAPNVVIQILQTGSLLLAAIDKIVIQCHCELCAQRRQPEHWSDISPHFYDK